MTFNMYNYTITINQLYLVLDFFFFLLTDSAKGRRVECEAILLHHFFYNKK